MSREKPKRFFGAVPGRALRDRRLTAQDIRNLAVIATHDQMSMDGDGQGAWASLKTMAKEANAEYTRFTKSVRKMIALGYLDCDRLKQDHRRCTYRVIYIDADRLPSQRIVGPTANYLRTGEGGNQSEIVDSTANRSSKGNWPYSQHVRYSAETEEDILLKQRDLDASRQARGVGFLSGSSTAVADQNPPQPGLAEERHTNVGGWLAQVERAMKSGEPVDYGSILAQLEAIHDSHHSENLRMWAFRLSEELSENDEFEMFDDVPY